MSFIKNISESFFENRSIPDQKNPIGQSWSLPNDIGSGYIWTWNHKNQFYIKIHNFSFYEDQLLDFNWPDSICINFYESISAVDTSTDSVLKNGDLQVFIGQNGETHSFYIRGKIPVRAIGFEIRPDYCRTILGELYTVTFKSLSDDLYHKLTDDKIREIYAILRQIERFHGIEPSATLYYQGKINEILSLIIQNHPNNNHVQKISEEDQYHLQNTVNYIRENYASKLCLEELTKVSVMGKTKLKQKFQQRYGCSVASYIRFVRIEESKKLLADTVLSIKEIGVRVGYPNASHFTQIFYRSEGMLPKEYRLTANSGPYSSHVTSN